MIKNELPETSLTLSDFHYELPEELIAQTPVYPRDSSRLMVIDRRRDTVSHEVFTSVIDHLDPKDVLVINETRVIPARIIGRRVKRASGEVDDSCAPVELLLLKQREIDVWEALAGPGKRARPGDVLEFGDGVMTANVENVGEGGCRIVRFIPRDEGETVYAALHRLGTVPLPPYIKEKLDDPERYQTVYAREPGSAAAPTAGLHFTKELLAEIEAMGVFVRFVTLHVGLGTFRPVKAENIEDHDMHSEYCTIPPETAETVNTVRKNGGRIIAVGTTSCRTLESFARPDGILEPSAGWTNIFIYPGYKFNCIDALVTNFHLPGSTLVMLVSALAGREHILNAYRCAVEERYRFFSFGDAMFIR